MATPRSYSRAGSPTSRPVAAAPAVRVIIPAYQTSAFIGETLDSVFRQTFDDFEVVVVNDGSPDTDELERALAPYRDRIVYITQENGGPSRARNTAIRHACGEFVAVLDSDDLLMPTYLDEQMRRLAEDPSLDLVYANGLIFGDSPLAGRTLMDASPSEGEVTFDRLIDTTCTVLTSCTVVRRRAAMDVGLFDERFRRSEDFHLWARLAFHRYRMAYQRQPLVRHRRRPGSLSREKLPMMSGIIEVLQDLQRILPLTAAQRARVERQIARRRAEIALEEGRTLFLAGHYGAAAAALGRAARCAPHWLTRARLRVVSLGLCLMPRQLRRLYDALHHSGAAVTATHPTS
jgi:glycosyltransferase involved in cell wall biosynthesis